MSEELKAEYEKQLRRIKRFVRSATKRGYEFPEHAIPKHPKVITEASVRKVASVTPDVLYKKATYTKNTGEKITGLEGRKHERQQAAVKAAETRATKAGKTYTPKAQKPTTRKVGKSKPRYSPKVKPKTKQKPKGKTKQKQKGKTAQGSKEKPSEKFYKRGDKKGKKGKREQAPERTTVVLDRVLETLENMIDTWSPNSNWTASLTIVKTKDKNIAKNLLRNAIDQLGREQVAKNCESKAEEIIPLLEEILYASGSKEGNFKDGRTQVNFDIIRFQNMLLGRATTPEENVELVDFMERLVYEDEDEDTMQYRSSVTYSASVQDDIDYNPQHNRRQGERSEVIQYSFEGEDDKKDKYKYKNNTQSDIYHEDD